MSRLARVLALVGSALCLAVGTAVFADGVEDLDAAWTKAVKSGDPAAVAALYAPEAVLYPPDVAEVRGSDAIRKYYEGMLGTMTVADVIFTEQNVVTRGSVSAGYGRATLKGTLKADGKPISIEVRVTELAEKKDGKWRFVADHASALPAPPSPAPGAAAPAATGR